MVHAIFGLLGLMGCMTSLRAVRYGDYSVANMPLYDYQHEVGEISSGTDEYRDRSSDAPARLDYKYEESLDKFEDEAIKNSDTERIWYTAHKNARKSPSSLDDSLNIDKNSFDHLEPVVKSNGKFGKLRSRFQNKKYKAQTQKRSKYFDRSDDSDKGESKNYDAEREGVDFTDGDDEFEDLRQRYVTRRKVRRKPRDRALNQLERAENRKPLPLEEQDLFSRTDRKPLFGMEDAKNPHAFNDRMDIVKSAKKNLVDYEEYYDMRRVQNLKERLPELVRPKTVTTSGAKRTRRFLEYWLNRRTISSVKHLESSEVPTSKTTSTTTVSSTTTTSASTETTATTTVYFGNSSELSLAEKSRLSILKKAQRKESGKAGSTTKPPVLMQVTRNMQTVVVVESEPRAVQRAREVAEETPERLQRARRLMRRKLVAGARSIHDLTDNWDELVCDYIDVSLLEADSAEMKKLNVVLVIILFSSVFLYNEFLSFNLLCLYVYIQTGV